MSSKDLLVPGTSGCKLLLDGVDIGWPAQISIQGWLAGASFGSGFAKWGAEVAADLVELLSMEFADAASWAPTKSTLKPGGKITAGPILDVAYNQFQGFEPFPYDWRTDIRHSAELLLAHLQAHKPADGKWRLLGHSQGCLVIIAASKRLAEEHDNDDRAFSSLVSHVAMLAPPLHGTVNAADALLNGDALGAGFAEKFKKIARTWPALHQMLPTWGGSVRRQVSPTLNQRTDFNLQDPRAWEGTGVSLEMLRRAKATRNGYLRDPVSMMNGVNKRILLSRAHHTRNHGLLSDGVLQLPAEYEPGDSLVPEETTHSFSGDNARDTMHAFGSTVNGQTMVHFMLANDPVIAADIKSFFAQ